MHIYERFEIGQFDPTGTDAISCDICGRDNGETAISIAATSTQPGNGHWCDEHLEAVAAAE